MPTIRLKKQNPTLLLSRQESETFIYDHSAQYRNFKFSYKTKINLIDKVNLKIDSNYFLTISYTKTQKQQFTITPTSLQTGSYLKEYVQQKIINSSEIVKRSFEKIKIPLNKSRLLKNKSDIIEFTIASNKVADNKLFTLSIIEIDSNGLTNPIDSLDINHFNNQEIYEIPTDNFDFNFSIIDRTKIIVEANTKDKRIGGFNIYIAKSTNQIDSAHRLVSAGKISLMEHSTRQIVQQKLKTKSLNTSSISLSSSIGSIQVKCDTNETNILRVIPTSSITTSRVFSNFRQKILIGKNVITKNVPFYISDKTNDTLTATIIDAPRNAIRVSLHRRNLTLNERNYTLIGTSSFLTRAAIILDVGYFDRFDYEYKTSYDTIDGLTKKFTIASQIAHSTRLGSNILLDTKILSSVFENRRIISKFNVTAKLKIVSAVSTLKLDLDALGLGSLFENNLTNISNNLQPLISIVVSRISKVTGLETFVGVFSPGEIIDSSPEELFLYRFEVAIRSAVELIESVASNQTNLAKDQIKIGGILSKASSIVGQAVSNKDTNFTSKFFTKTSIIDSTLRYGNSSKSIDYDNELGRTGIVSFLTVMPKSSNVKISNIETFRTFDGIKITCTIVAGNNSDMDIVSIQNGNLTTLIMPTSSGKISFYIPKNNKSRDIIMSGISINKELLFSTRVAA